MARAKIAGTSLDTCGEEMIPLVHCYVCGRQAHPTLLHAQWGKSELMGKSMPMLRLIFLCDRCYRLKPEEGEPCH